MVGHKSRKRKRATLRRVLEISRVARSRKLKDRRARLQAGYRRLLAVVRATVHDAKRVMTELAQGARVAIGPRAGKIVTRAQTQLAQLLPLVQRAIAQTQARILGGDTHYHDKLFSLFEPHTEAIRKGKASKPTEFGKLVKLQEAAAFLKQLLIPEAINYGCPVGSAELRVANEDCCQQVAQGRAREMKFGVQGPASPRNEVRPVPQKRDQSFLDLWGVVEFQVLLRHRARVPAMASKNG